MNKKKVDHSQWAAAMRAWSDAEGRVANLETTLAFAVAEADYWFGITDMRERLLAEQRDKLEKLSNLCDFDQLCIDRFDCKLGDRCPQYIVATILGANPH